VNPQWWLDAACQGQDTELFVPSGYTRLSHSRALEFCRQCSVQFECLAAALEEEGTRPADHRFGVRGGLVPSQRHEIHVRMREQR
jgi:hypothetical protein